MAVLAYREGTTNRTITRLIQQKIGAYPDGIWGKNTTECLKAWQKAHSLTPDGIAGPATLAAMCISAVTPSSGTPSSTVSQITACYGGKAVTLKKSKRRIDYIAIHCTATPEGQAKTVEDIRREHKAQGWADIGYHYVVTLDGTVHEGRDVDLMGAHVSGYNPYSIGIAYVGGLENRPGVAYDKLKAKDTRTEKQKSALISLLQDLRRLYPKAIIQGHRDFSKDLNGNGTIEPWERIKDCPSFDAKTEYRNT